MDILINLGKGLTIGVSKEKETEAIEEAMFWLRLPKACPTCGSGLTLNHYKTKEHGYKYYGLQCLGQPHHYANFSQHKDNLKFYFKRDTEWKEFSPKSEEGF